VTRLARYADLKRLKRFRWIAAALLAGQFLIAPITKIEGWPRTYPIDSWSLFSKVPNQITDYSIRIVELNGRPLTESIWFDQSPSKHSHSHNARTVILKMGSALEDGHEREADRLQNVFLSNFVSDLPGARFEFVRRRYEVLERFRTHQFDEVTVLRTFDGPSSIQLTDREDVHDFGSVVDEGIFGEAGEIQ